MRHTETEGYPRNLSTDRERPKPLYMYTKVVSEIITSKQRGISAKE